MTLYKNTMYHGFRGPLDFSRYPIIPACSPKTNSRSVIQYQTDYQSRPPLFNWGKVLFKRLRLESAVVLDSNIQNLPQVPRRRRLRRMPRKPLDGYDFHSQSRQLFSLSKTPRVYRSSRKDNFYNNV